MNKHVFIIEVIKPYNELLSVFDTEEKARAYLRHERNAMQIPDTTNLYFCGQKEYRIHERIIRIDKPF